MDDSFAPPVAVEPRFFGAAEAFTTVASLTCFVVDDREVCGFVVVVLFRVAILLQITMQQL
jgi:hypothetical protein